MMLWAYARLMLPRVQKNYLDHWPSTIAFRPWKAGTLRAAKVALRSVYLDSTMSNQSVGACAERQWTNEPLDVRVILLKKKCCTSW